MAAGINQGSDIAAYVMTIYEMANVVARDNNVMAALVTGFNTAGTATRTRSEYGTATIHQIGDADDLTSQVFKPTTQQSLTPYEYGAQFFLTDTRLENDPFNYASEAATELGVALGQKVETDLLSTFSSLTGGTILSATNMTWGLFFAALSLLRTQNAPMPYSFVCHPYQWHSMGSALMPGLSVSQTNAPALQDSIIQNFWRGNVSGVNIYTTSNIASGTGCVAGMFARPAIALDVRRATRIERERDASRRGYELNLSTIYATGVWRPAFGVTVQSAGTAPTL